MRRALIVGIAGQDGSYLAKHLLDEGYEVWGLVHRRVNPQAREALRDVHMVRGDLLDGPSVTAAIERSEPDEVYNLGAISYVPHSWEHAELSGSINGLGAVHLLEAVRSYSGITESRSPGPGQIRFYQASSSEVFGKATESPQNEQSPIRPCTPYGSAKAHAQLMTQTYRERYGMFAVNGILYNHESPRRAAEFVSRKVSLGAASVKLGLERKIRLGNLQTTRDWGFAGDYVLAMHLMLAQDDPEDYVVGTGVSHSVEDLVSRAFSLVGLNWRDHVRCDAGFIRSVEPQNLRADPRKAKQRLGWTATLNFDDLVSMMVESDLELLANHGEVYRVPELETW